jgi:hypothetical protein
MGDALCRFCGGSMEKDPKNMATRFSLDWLLKLAQIIAIVAAGSWALYEFLTFKGKANKLANEIASLSVTEKRMDGEMKNLQLRNLAAEQSVQQVKALMDLKMSSLDVADKQVNLRYAEQEKRFQQLQNELTLQLSNLAIAEKRRQGELEDLKIDYTRSRRLDHLISVDVDTLDEQPDGSVQCDVQLGFKIVNRSEVSLEISGTIVEAFVGSLPSRGRLAELEPVLIRVNMPPNVFNSIEAVNEGVRWRKVSSESFVFADALDDLGKDVFFSRSRPASRNMGDGATGRINFNESTDFTYTYSLSAKKTDLLGFVVNVFLNRGIKNEDHWFFNRAFKLWKAERVGHSKKEAQ